MEKLSLYEVMFEGKKERTCDNCMHQDVCEMYSHVVPMDDGDCEIWEDEDEKSLYDVMFGDDENYDALDERRKNDVVDEKIFPYLF